MPNFKKLLTDNIYPILFTVLVLIFFYPFILFGKIPIPADTIVGMYHPFRDTVWDGFTGGVPFKNFLITDPVRQQYVWRKIAIEELKEGKLPLWNPYSFSGTPLLANFQTAAFYPLNIVFFILPFDLAWGVLIVLQPLLAGLFLYSYLRFIRVSKIGSFLGALVFSFSGFTIAWLEWNTIIHTILWLPLILLAKEKLLVKITFKWMVLLFFAEVSSFLAGHLQILFYTLIISNVYLIVRIAQFSIKSNQKENILISAFKKYLPFFIIGLFVFIVSSIQWLPTLQFIADSSRQFDQGSFTKDGWFLPWQNLIQFIIPDFFGNPATGNYWGIWNYGEFIGYIGLLPFIFVLLGIIFVKNSKTLFWGLIGFIALIFALPTPLAKLIYQLQIPFISTSQPTRLMVIVDFSLSILAALGFDWFLKNMKDRNTQKKLVSVTSLFILIFLTIWLFVLNPSWMITVVPENLLIIKRNLIFPTITMVFFTLFFLGHNILKADMYRTKIIYAIVIILTVVDLFRFGWKFTPFARQDWVFPQTNILKTITLDKSYGRVMMLDRRILPPNFSAAYRLQDVSGYDPLYFKEYGQLVASWDRDKPDISPAAFNRIITPVNYESFITDLIGVKYIMSFGSLKSDKLEYLSKEGETYLYTNKKAFPRAFLVDKVVRVVGAQETIDKMFNLAQNLRTTAVVDENIEINSIPLQSGEEAIISYYSPNYITIEVNTIANRLLVLSDIYYPIWQVFIDGKSAKMYKVDFVFRGVIVPSGIHNIEFKTNLL